MGAQTRLGVGEPALGVKEELDQRGGSVHMGKAYPRQRPRGAEKWRGATEEETCPPPGTEGRLSKALLCPDVLQRKWSLTMNSRARAQIQQPARPQRQDCRGRKEAFSPCQCSVLHYPHSFRLPLSLWFKTQEGTLPTCKHAIPEYVQPDHLYR